jgi:hypothetical protein
MKPDSLTIAIPGKSNLFIDMHIVFHHKVLFIKEKREYEVWSFCPRTF